MRPFATTALGVSSAGATAGDDVLLGAIVAGPVALSTLPELARRLGQTVDVVADRLAELDVAGLVVGWPVPACLYVTLTPLGAAWLAVRIVEVSREETPRWARAGELDPPLRKAAGVFRGEPAGVLALVAGPPSDDPAEIAEAGEVQLGDLPDPHRPIRSLPGTLAPTAWRAVGPKLPGSCLVCGTGHDDRCSLCN